MQVRNCAWADKGQAVSERAVWARGGVFSTQCPKSVITAQSLYFIDQFAFWKEFGGKSIWGIEAKTAEALLVLDQAWRMENQNGEVQE
ncbi:MAG: hypothetical protein ACJ74Z_11105 [Bryobacteraceae bacterium]